MKWQSHLITHLMIPAYEVVHGSSKAPGNNIDRIRKNRRQMKGSRRAPPPFKNHLFRQVQVSKVLNREILGSVIVQDLEKK